MALQISEITHLFETHGAARYGGEAINQLQALQCAHQAEQAGASPELITAALLHDLGHLLTGQAGELPESVDDVHQYVALPFLRGLFPDAVIEPIRLHVDAKRYLCAADASYWASLSPASQRSLELQGGPFSVMAAATFLERPFAADAVALRRWDDLAKNPLAQPPAWAHYLRVIERIKLPPLTAAA
jgi:phosphonate degradation associated HDIG domain protein